jgi:DNA polymerase-3 subunit alpha
LGRSDFEAHETRVCIAQGVTLDDPARQRAYSEEQYLKSPAEMERLFADLPEAVANTVEIARRCSLEVDIGKVFLPDFKVDDGSAPRDHLKQGAAAGLTARLAALGIAPEAAGPYHERLAREIAVICKMGFEGYVLIVADFIAWARNNAIPVGPGRGSGVGSLVAYALGITNLDPLAHDLLFERFLNPERVSLPDIDIDFCERRRGEVIKYVTQKYGTENVAQIITFGTMKARAVVRDVGRVLEMSFADVDKVAKQIPAALDMTLDKALEENPVLREM